MSCLGSGRFSKVVEAFTDNTNIPPVHARIGVHIQMSYIDTCPVGELKLPDPCQNDHRININFR